MDEYRSYQDTNADRQDYFDKTVTHLLSMKERAIIDAGTADEACCYLTSDGGLSCAVGIHIPTKVYDREMEEFSIDELQSWKGYEGVIVPLGEMGLELACDLQGIHDKPENWNQSEAGMNMTGSAAFKKVAERFNLDWNHG